MQALSDKLSEDGRRWKYQCQKILTAEEERWLSGEWFQTFLVTSTIKQKAMRLYFSHGGLCYPEDPQNFVPSKIVPLTTLSGTAKHFQLVRSFQSVFRTRVMPVREWGHHSTIFFFGALSSFQMAEILPFHPLLVLSNETANEVLLKFRKILVWRKALQWSLEVLTNYFLQSSATPLSLPRSNTKRFRDQSTGKGIFFFTLTSRWRIPTVRAWELFALVL